ncbi:MAG: hypothetical protein KR126chlam1_01219 [Chlamydiae bacterium]|nr:hypothetical protein [Chlamydiota bacterium]
METFSTIIFFIAVAHAFFSDKFLKIAHKFEAPSKRGFAYVGFAFLGNVAIIFGFWMIPILLYMLIMQGVSPTYDFLHSMDFREPFAYFVLITLAMTRPLRQLFESLMIRMSHSVKHQLIFWWCGTILFSSILTGIFSEIAIMTLACLYLAEKFFPLKPGRSLSYFTLALLLVGISIGTTIIPVNFTFLIDFLTQGKISHWEIFRLFGWKMLIGLVVIILGGALLFRKELDSLQKTFKKAGKPPRISSREIIYGLLFFTASFGKGNMYLLLMVIAIVIILHKYPYRIKGEEGELSLYIPLLIAFFTYTLELHASLQAWWVTPLLERLQGGSAYVTTFFLTGLNEHVPLEALKVSLQGKAEGIKFFSYLAVLTGGGLTIIAKSANIVAKKTLIEHFPDRVISPFRHLLVAVPLAAIVFGLGALFHCLGL